MVTNITEEEELQHKIDKLIAAMDKYGRHLETCTQNSEKGSICTCGFDMKGSI